MKFLLDTNVWSYVARTKMMPDLLRACSKKRIKFLVAPASVTEARSQLDPELRKQLLSIMTHERWTRLMPDTFLEAQEIKVALLALRPQWAIAQPDTREFNKLRYYWLRRDGGFWQFFRDEVPLPVTNESIREQRENGLARQEVRAIRDLFKEGSQREALTHLQKVTLEANAPIVGKTTVEYWRLATAYHLRQELQVYASPYREWLDCEIDVFAMMSDMDDFENAWFCELQPSQAKRQWLRASMEYLQRWHKPTSGSPADSQLASHLVDADYFVTADKNFAKCVEKIHDEAPFTTARPLKVKSERDGVEELLEFVSAIPTTGKPNSSRLAK